MSPRSVDVQRVVDDIVAAFPPISEQQRATLARLLWAPVEAGETR